MKKIHFIFLLLGFCLQCNAQDSEFGILMDYSNIAQRNQISIGGFMRFPLHERILLNYQVSVGIDNSNRFYLNTYAGGYVAVYMAARKPDNWWLAELALFVPQGVSIRPFKRKNYWIDLDPFVIDYWHKQRPFDDLTRTAFNFTISRRGGVSIHNISHFAPFLCISRKYGEEVSNSKFGFKAGIRIALGANNLQNSSRIKEVN